MPAGTAETYTAHVTAAAAVQFNGVYPTPDALVASVKFRGASDKRYSSSLAGQRTVVARMQQLNITPGVVFALLIVVLLVLGSYWFMRSGNRPSPLRGMPRTHGVQPATQAHAEGAQQLQISLNQLHQTNAGWDDILQTVNPSGTANVAANLQAIRGPHMFAPALAIRVLQEGCRLALARNPKATVPEAVQFARESMEKITRYGD